VSTLNNKDARGSHFTDASKASVIRRARVCGKRRVVGRPPIRVRST